MHSAFTPAMKWMIGTLTVAFVGLGSWLGYELTKRGTAPKTADATLPAPVTTTLTEPGTEAGERNRQSVISDQPEKAATSTAKPQATQVAQVSARATPTSESKPATLSEATLEASVASSATGDQVLITVAANQPIQAGFDSSSGEFADARTLTVNGFTGTRTLVVRTRGGQELRFTIIGSPNSTTATTAARS